MEIEQYTCVDDKGNTNENPPFSLPIQGTLIDRSPRTHSKSFIFWDNECVIRTKFLTLELIMVCDWDTYFMQCAGYEDLIDHTGAGCCYQEQCYSYVIQSNTESDAFVPAISQRGDLLQTKPTRLQRVENVDHKSMTFSTEILNTLTRAFNGENGVEFTIDTR